jgi:hypothetical protein
MNEQIDQLMVKAGAYFGGDGVVYDNFDPKKFAELIVLECASLFEDDLRPMGDFTERACRRAIKEHFGVE